MASAEEIRAQAPLAGYFPEPGGPQPDFDDGFNPAAQAFMSGRLDDIVAACVAHRYQMNEVARCTQIAWAFPRPPCPVTARSRWLTWAPARGSDCSWTGMAT